MKESKNALMQDVGGSKSIGSMERFLAVKYIYFAK